MTIGYSRSLISAYGSALILASGYMLQESGCRIEKFVKSESFYDKIPGTFYEYLSNIYHVKF